jgi:L-alanine-DL-glutamate epimerase-like enolase superfamily enzyme
MKTAHICEGYGIMCAIHGGSIASLHAACAIYNSRFFERLVPEAFLSPPGIRDASTGIDSDGNACPWDSPGLGIEVDWDWLEALSAGTEE